MQELVKINNQDIAVKEYRGKRVVTFKDIDAVHQRAEGTARKRFNDNKQRFINGMDYFVRKTDEAKQMEITAPNGLILLTETGYLMLVKSFTDELAWQVQRQLVNSYFAKSKSEVAKEDTKNRLLATREENVKIRKAQLLYKVSKDCKVESYREVLQSHIAAMLTGEQLLPLPKAQRRVYSAAEVGDMLNISANRVGHLTNAHGLKTAEFGEWVWDKSKYSAHECRTFRYYIEVVAKLKELLKEVA